MSDVAYSGGHEDAARVEPRVADFIQLLKPRVMSLVLFTGVVGLVAAPGSIHPVTAVIALIAIAVGAGASGAINMWYDADIDGLMRRTADRGIPSGRVERESALAFGLFLAGASVVTMGLLVGYVAAGYLAFTIAFYAVIYTMWLKRWTPQNIVIGGAAGALPPVIGWVAVTGEAVPDFGAWTLFALIFMWTPPHFWALALFRKDDYAIAKVPMLPVVAGERRTRREILVYTLLLAATSALPYAAGVAGEVYLALAVAGGGAFVMLAFRTWREADGSYREARRLFGFSILYLFVLFAAVLVEQVGGRVG